MRRESNVRNIIAGTVVKEILPLVAERSEVVIGERVRGFVVGHISGQVWRLINDAVAKPVKDTVYWCMHAV